MKILIFTKEDGPEMREALDLGHELESRGALVEFIEAESPEGSEKVSLYDIYSTPSFVVTQDDGSIVNIWRGYIPPLSEIEHELMI